MNTLPLIRRGLDDIIMSHGDKPVTATRFIGQAARLAAQLPESGRVINLCEDRYAFGVVFAATVMAGGANLLPANRLPATIDALLERFRDALIVSDRPVGAPQARVIDPANALSRGPEASRIPDIPADQLAAIVFTSGSTGPSSRIDKPWRTLYESSRINYREIGPRQFTHAVATVPPQHMWGLETSVLMPWFGPLCMASGQPFFAADICHQIRQLPRPRALISTPVHLRALTESQLTLPAVDRVYSATAPLSRTLARQIEAATGGQVIEVYGCSETGCLARRNTARESDWTLFERFSLRAEGDSVIAHAAHLPEPQFLMDRLERIDDRHFRLLGRCSDLVNIAGKRASLAELTGILLDIPGVVDGVIFQPPESRSGPSHRLAALVVAPGMSTAGIRTALAERVDAAFMPRPLRLVDALPRADSGKLPRQSLMRFFRKTCEPAE